MRDYMFAVLPARTEVVRSGGYQLYPPASGNGPDVHHWRVYGKTEGVSRFMYNELTLYLAYSYGDFFLGECGQEERHE